MLLATHTHTQVDMTRHTTPLASSSLLYDQSFNVIYLSSYNRTSYSGEKKVLKVRLAASYNFLSETSSSTTSDRSLVKSAMAATRYSVPWQQTSYPRYTDGFSFDHAAIEPLSNSLFFYVPTQLGANSFASQLFYIPVPVNDGGGSYTPTGERDALPVLVSTDPNYGTRTLSSIAYAYNTENPIAMLFTLYAGLFVRLDGVSQVQEYTPLGKCSQCPPRMTSSLGATSNQDCFCEQGYFLNAQGRYVSVAHLSARSSTCNLILINLCTSTR
jgi:hypothetical protein